MKKYIYSLFLLIWAFGFLNSCKLEEKLLFKEDAAQRLDTRIEQYRDLITSSEHGWVMEYYPGGPNQEYGGWIVVVKFDKSGKCHIQNTYNDDVTNRKTSDYTIGKDVGPTLNFVTFNENVHIFASPDVEFGGGKGKGLEGDYEFVLGKIIDQDNFEMRGKKHSSLIKVHRLKEDPNTYLKKVKEMEATLTDLPGVISGIEGTLGGKPVTGTFFTDQCIHLRQDDDILKMAYIFTDTGVKLYQEYTLGSHTIKDLLWDKDNLTFKSSDGVLNLKVLHNPNARSIEQFEGKYQLKYKHIPPGGRPAEEKILNIELEAHGNDILAVTEAPWGLDNLYFDFSTEDDGILVLSPHKVSRNVLMATIGFDTEDKNQLSEDEEHGFQTEFTGDKDNFKFRFIPRKNTTWEVDGKKVTRVGFIFFDLSTRKLYEHPDAPQIAIFEELIKVDN